MTMRPGRPLGWVALAGALVLALAAGAAMAATPKSSKPKAAPTSPAAPPAVAAPAPVVAGLMAFLDPDTGLLTGPIGHLVPPADQQAATANVLLEPVQRANGAWLLDLKGTMLEHYVIHVDPFGRRRALCVQDQRLPHVHGPQPLLPAAPAGEER